jgi:hypothetical protein
MGTADMVNDFPRAIMVRSESWERSGGPIWPLRDAGLLRRVL